VADPQPAIVISEMITPRLRLRRWRDSDFEPFAALNADPVVMRYFRSTLTRAESDAMVGGIEEGFARRGFGFWALEHLETGAFVGMTGLSVPGFDAPFMPAVEIGWRLARAHWGRGYATEAAQVALTAAFDRLFLDEVVAFTVPTNTRSRRVMERIGMRRDLAGDFDHPRVPERHPLRRHVLYRVGRRAVAGPHATG
jgi:RimJ/RimL family protein N-acetyltransferase